MVLVRSTLRGSVCGLSCRTAGAHGVSTGAVSWTGDYMPVVVRLGCACRAGSTGTVCTFEGRGEDSRVRRHPHDQSLTCPLLSTTDHHFAGPLSWDVLGSFMCTLFRVHGRLALPPGEYLSPFKDSRSAPCVFPRISRLPSHSSEGLSGIVSVFFIQFMLELHIPMVLTVQVNNVATSWLCLFVLSHKFWLGFVEISPILVQALVRQYIVEYIIVSGSSSRTRTPKFRLVVPILSHTYDLLQVFIPMVFDYREHGLRCGKLLLRVMCRWWCPGWCPGRFWFATDISMS